MNQAVRTARDQFHLLCVSVFRSGRVPDQLPAKLTRAFERLRLFVVQKRPVLPPITESRCFVVHHRPSHRPIRPMKAKAWTPTTTQEPPQVLTLRQSLECLVHLKQLTLCRLEALLKPFYLFRGPVYWVHLRGSKETMRMRWREAYHLTPVVQCSRALDLTASSVDAVMRDTMLVYKKGHVDVSRMPEQDQLRLFCALQMMEGSPTLPFLLLHLRNMPRFLIVTRGSQ